ncbi:MAG: N-6 DNA methylase [candidate division WOR-3 bacterium]
MKNKSFDNQKLKIECLKKYRKILSKVNKSRFSFLGNLGSDFLKLLFIKYIYLNEENIKKFIILDEGLSWKNLSEIKEDVGIFIDKIFENLAKNNENLSVFSFLENFSEQKHRRVPFDKRFSLKSREKILIDFIEELNKDSFLNQKNTFNLFVKEIITHQQHFYYRINGLKYRENTNEVLNYLNRYIEQKIKNKEDLSFYIPYFKRSEFYFDIILKVATQKSTLKIYCNEFWGEAPALTMLKLFLNGIYNVEIRAKKEPWFVDFFKDEKEDLKKYDLVFVDMIDEKYDIDEEQYRKLKEKIETDLKLYLDSKNIIYSFLLDSLNEKGVLILLTNYNFLTVSGSKKEVRKFLVENNYLDEVISIYGFLKSPVGYDPVIVLVDKNREKNRKVTFVDLERVVTKLSQKNKSEEKNILNENLDILKDIEYAMVQKKNEDIKENDYNFNVFKYLSYLPQDYNEALEEIAKRLNGTTEEFQKRLNEFLIKIKKLK